MDQPDILAVKLNTRDRKGLGSQPRARPNAQFYHLQRDQPPSVTALARPAPAHDKLNHSVPSLAKGCAASAPVPCGAALAWRPISAPALAPGDAPQLGGCRQRRALCSAEGAGTTMASSAFPIVYGRSEGTSGASMGQTHPESCRLGSLWVGEPADGQPQAVVGAERSCSSYFIVVLVTQQANGGEEFLVFQCAGLVWRSC